MTHITQFLSNSALCYKVNRPMQDIIYWPVKHLLYLFTKSGYTFDLFMLYTLCFDDSDSDMFIGLLYGCAAAVLSSAVIMAVWRGHYYNIHGV